MSTTDHIYNNSYKVIMAAESMEISIDSIRYRLMPKTKTAVVISDSSKYQGEIQIPSEVIYRYYEFGIIQSMTFKVNTIGEKAFFNCSLLISIDIPDSITEICDNAFNGCSSLESITIPKSIKKIGNWVFAWCPSLKTIDVHKKNKVYDNRENCNAIIETETDTLIVGCQNTIIPDSISSIEEFAFAGCSSFRKIYIPENIVYIGAGAFAGCSSVTSIVVDKNNEVYDSRNRCNAIVETEANTLITGCQNTIIPNSITTIDDAAFAKCSSLISIAIPNSVQHINSYAFSGCSGLLSITLPDTLQSIGEYAFQSCKSLTSIAIPNRINEINENTFSCCSSLVSITIPNSVTSIEDRAFSNCQALQTISLPRKLTNLGKSIFFKCDELITIRVPKGKKEEYCTLGLEKYSDLIHEPHEEEYELLFNVAKAYELGVGIAKNLAQAVLCYSKASDKGCAAAAYRIGELYEKGEGLPKDYQQAIDWYAKAMNLYHPSAEMRMRYCQHILKNIESDKQTPFASSTDITSKYSKKYLFFDTECNGLPDNYNSDVTATNNWPRMIQLAWIITDEQGIELKRQSYLIYPEGFKINVEVAKLTRISTERARSEGISLSKAITEFMNDVDMVHMVIGHNVDFDLHIVGCELYRMEMDYGAFMNKPNLCTMLKSINYCAIPKSNSYWDEYKWPKLEELYQILFDCKFGNAHDALSDVEATKECYFELKKIGVID